MKEENSRRKLRDLLPREIHASESPEDAKRRFTKINEEAATNRRGPNQRRKNG